MADSSVTPGWYSDPEDSSGSRLRWWDGTAWTEHYSPAADPAISTGTTVLPLATEAQKPSSKTPLILAVVGVASLLIIVAGVAAVLLLPAGKTSSANSTESVVTAEGATVDLPAGWKDVPLNRGQLDEFMNEAAATNPDIADALHQALSTIGDRGFAMFAISPGLSTDTLVTNANLIVVANSGASLSTLSAGVTAKLEQLGATEVTTTPVEANGVPALRTEYTVKPSNGDGKVTAYGIQYLVIGDQNVAVLTVTSPSDNAAADADAMAQSMVVD